jgi:drug/metabolite transporter (DMT)-like permease
MNQNNDIQGLQSSGQSHKLSIAQIIGTTIGVIGLVILLYDLFGQADYSRSGGINIDLWWGLLMVVFGITMVAGGYTSAHRQTVTPGQGKPDRR